MFSEMFKNFEIQKPFTREELDDILLFENGVSVISCQVTVETPAYFPSSFSDVQVDMA
jgi:hypothetical protein